MDVRSDVTKWRREFLLWKAVQNGGRSNSKKLPRVLDSFRHFRKEKITFIAFDIKSKLFQ